MSKNRPKYNDKYASLIKGENYGTIFESMCLSAAYQSLGNGAKQFYTMCRVEARSKQGGACLYKHSNEYGITYNENDFVFPSSHLRKYGYDRSNASHLFDELEAAGFVIRKEKNKHIRKTSVYSFSEKWKLFDKKNDEKIPNIVDGKEKKSKTKTTYFFTDGTHKEFIH